MNRWTVLLLIIAEGKQLHKSVSVLEKLFHDCQPMNTITIQFVSNRGW